MSDSFNFPIDDSSDGISSTFQDYFDEYYLPLVYFSDSLISDNKRAQEIVTKVFCTLWHKRNDFFFPSNVKAFLYISVLDSSLSFLRYGSLEVLPGDDTPREVDKWDVRSRNAAIKSETLRLLTLELKINPDILLQNFKRKI